MEVIALGLPVVTVAGAVPGIAAYSWQETFFAAQVPLPALSPDQLRQVPDTWRECQRLSPRPCRLRAEERRAFCIRSGSTDR